MVSTAIYDRLVRTNLQKLLCEACQNPRFYKKKPRINRPHPPLNFLIFLLQKILPYYDDTYAIISYEIIEVTDGL